MRGEGGIVQVGEAWGREEEAVRKPFVGSSGQENWRMWGQAIPDLWPEEHSRISSLFDPHSQSFCGNMWILQRDAWLHEAGISFTNVFNGRPATLARAVVPAEQMNNLELLCGKKVDVGKDYPFSSLSRGLYLRPEFFPQLDRLRRELEELRPNLIVAAGNTACWALLGTTNIGSIRGTITQTNPSAPVFDGHEVAPIKVLPTYHPASVLYNWSYRPTVIIDYIKAVREAKFPEVRRPQRHILISPTLEEVREWVCQTFANLPKWLACDTETTAGHIDTISFARSPTDAIVIPLSVHRYRRGESFVYVLPQGRANYWTQQEEEMVRKYIQELLGSPIPKLFQNGMYDMQYLLREGYRLNNISEDSMLAHHALYPELPKGLGFLGSIYTDEPAWKLMRKYHGDSEKRDE